MIIQRPTGWGRASEQAEYGECRGQLIGASPQMAELRALVSRIACVDSAVLISGEIGSGKRSTAEAIHFSGSRSAGPLAILTCDAGESSEIERELIEDRLPSAEGGTLLLEEVGALSLRAQVRLLHHLQERKRPGFRTIATTVRPLVEAVADGSFRRDLYFALNVVPLETPPLRERLVDLPLLVEQWNERFTQRNGARAAGFTAGALDLLRRYPWPGNLQELEGVLERAVVLAGEGAAVDASAFAFLNERPGASLSRHTTAGEAAVADPLLTLDELERRHVLRALAHTHQNRTRAASLLNISVRTLRNKLHLYRSQGMMDLPTEGA